MFKREKTKGITLIALVITIIILLILAGVTISMLTGENGILKQATNARNVNSKAEFEEQVKLAVMASRINEDGSINLTTLEKEINKITGTKITKQEDGNLPWTVKKESYEITITAEGTTTTTGKGDENKDETNINYGEKLPSEDKRTTLEQATAAAPTGGTIDPDNNDPNTGIVMKDSSKNEWVWIEVPASVFTTAKNNTDYKNIKTDLVTYAQDYRITDGNLDEIVTRVMDGEFWDCWTKTEYYDDYWDDYVNPATGTTTRNLNDVIGIKTVQEYNEKYQKMLSSIYTNKGFYIGRYEAGIDGSDKDISLGRIEYGEITSDSPKVVIKKDMIPYDYISVKDSQKLANEIESGDKTTSLMFGLQWDLVCKFLEVKGTAQSNIKEDSTSWGNYYNSSFTIDSANAKKFIQCNNTYVDSKYESVSGSKSNGTGMVLSTGASEHNKKMNIYDFAGNVSEYTLECDIACYSDPIISRGRDANSSSDKFASCRGRHGYVGFRPTMY